MEVGKNTEQKEHPSAVLVNIQIEATILATNYPPSNPGVLGQG